VFVASGWNLSETAFWRGGYTQATFHKSPPDLNAFQQLGCHIKAMVLMRMQLEDARNICQTAS
jgi:hypothetical protein